MAVPLCAPDSDTTHTTPLDTEGAHKGRHFVLCAPSVRRLGESGSLTNEGPQQTRPSSILWLSSSVPRTG